MFRIQRLDMLRKFSGVGVTEASSAELARFAGIP